MLKTDSALTSVLQCQYFSCAQQKENLRFYGVHNCHKKSNPPIACTVKWGCKENLVIYGFHNCHMRDDEKGFYSIYATILRSILKIFTLKPGIVFTLRHETRAAMIFHVHRETRFHNLWCVHNCHKNSSPNNSPM